MRAARARVCVCERRLQLTDELGTRAQTGGQASAGAAFYFFLFQIKPNVSECEAEALSCTEPTGKFILYVFDNSLFIISYVLLFHKREREAH